MRSVKKRRRTAPPARSTSRCSPTACKAEREQGITIDVAYRYFATARRKFILADTPGHEQYTRNMATGASTADVAILLVDARHGVRTQSRRHARIARLLGITDFVARHQQDGPGRLRPERLRRASATSSRTLLHGATLQPIPLSALHGDNVITPSDRTPWFEGPPLLEYLETVEVDRDAAASAVPVPGAAGGPADARVPRLRRADRVGHGQRRRHASRSGRRAATTRVKRIVTWDGDLRGGVAPMSVTLVLDDEIDISRGDVLADGSRRTSAQRFEAEWCGWTSGRSIRRASTC